MQCIFDLHEITMKKITSILFFNMLAISMCFAQSLSGLYEKVDPSVVVIKTKQKQIVSKQGQTATAEGVGSGVLISENGEILTAAHVVQVAEHVEVEFANGEVIPAKIISTVQTADVALVKVLWMPKKYYVAPIGNSDNVKIGDDIFIIGTPFALGHSLSKGIISGRHKEHSKTSELMKVEFFQTDASINQGNSGGPMFNMKGEVIGIVSFILSKSGGFDGIGFAATTNLAYELLINEDRGWNGVESIIVAGEVAKILNLPQSAGILLTDVVPLSPAGIAGLQGGDYIAEIAGQEVVLGGDIILEIENIRIDSQESIEKIMEIMSKIERGSSFKIKYLRGGKVLETNVIKPKK